MHWLLCEPTAQPMTPPRTSDFRVLTSLCRTDLGDPGRISLGVMRRTCMSGMGLRSQIPRRCPCKSHRFAITVPAGWARGEGELSGNTGFSGASGGCQQA